MEATRTFYLARGLPVALVDAAEATPLAPVGKTGNFFASEDGAGIDLIGHICTCEDFRAEDCPTIAYHNGKTLRYCRHLLAATMMYRMANRPAPPRRIKAGPAYPLGDYCYSNGEDQEYHPVYGKRYK